MVTHLADLRSGVARKDRDDEAKAAVKLSMFEDEMLTTPASDHISRIL